MTTQRAPRGWKKRVKRVLLNVISLGRVCTSVLEAEDAVSSDPAVRGSAEGEAQQREIRLFREELALKDARMGRVPARRRPHYSAIDRMRILELKAARRWSGAEAAGHSEGGSMMHETPWTPTPPQKDCFEFAREPKKS